MRLELNGMALLMVVMVLEVVFGFDLFFSLAKGTGEGGKLWKLPETAETPPPLLTSLLVVATVFIVEMDLETEEMVDADSILCVEVGRMECTDDKGFIWVLASIPMCSRTLVEVKAVSVVSSGPSGELHVAVVEGFIVFAVVLLLKLPLDVLLVVVVVVVSDVVRILDFMAFTFTEFGRLGVLLVVTKITCSWYGLEL